MRWTRVPSAVTPVSYLTNNLGAAWVPLRMVAITATSFPMHSGIRRAYGMGRRGNHPQKT